MFNAKEVTFSCLHKMLNSGIERMIQITLDVPERFPTGVKLTEDDITKYIKQRYGFEVFNLK
jgi:hypothetical protein